MRLLKYGKVSSSCGSIVSTARSGMSPTIDRTLSGCIPPLGRCRNAPFLGGLVIQLDHDAVGVIDEDLPEVAARHLSGVEVHAFRLQALFHAVKAGRGKGDVVDNAGIRLLCLIGLRNVDEVHDGLALAVHPGAGEGEVRPGTLFEAQNVLIETDRIGEVPGPDVEMIEHTHAHAHAKHSLFCEAILIGNHSTKPPD